MTVDEFAQLVETEGSNIVRKCLSDGPRSEARGILNAVDLLVDRLHRLSPPAAPGVPGGLPQEIGGLQTTAPVSS